MCPDSTKTSESEFLYLFFGDSVTVARKAAASASQTDLAKEWNVQWIRRSADDRKDDLVFGWIRPDPPGINQLESSWKFAI